jgi:hypothetical protein
MPRVLVCTEEGHQLPRIELAQVPHVGDELSLVAPNGSRRWFDVVRVAWTALDPHAAPDSFLATEGGAKSEDAILVVRLKSEIPDGAPYRMFARR